MSVKTAADWFDHATKGHASNIKSGKKKWKGTKDADGNTALMLVSKLAGNGVFDLLIPDEAGNINNEGHSALSIAVLAGQTEKVRRLAPLEGSMVLARGCTALIYAASLRAADLVPLLAPYSVLDQCNSDGYTALDIAVSNNDTAFTKALIGVSRINLNVLDAAIRRSLSPESIDVNQVLMEYRAGTYPNADPLDPDAEPFEHADQSSGTLAPNPQGTLDPGYITSAFGDAGRSVSLIDATPQASAKAGTKEPKSGKSSRASSKQSSVRRSPGPETKDGDSPTLYGQGYGANVTAAQQNPSNSDLQYSMTPNGIMTDVQPSQYSNAQLTVSRLNTPTVSTVLDFPDASALQTSQSVSQQPQYSYVPTGSFSTNTAVVSPSSRLITDSMTVPGRQMSDLGMGMSPQMQKMLREKQAIIDDLKSQTIKLNKELVEAKRSLHKAELASATSQGHWATQSALDTTNKVITDMQEQAREMKNEALRAKNFFEAEREKLVKIISEKAQKIAVLENMNRNLDADCDRLRAANKDLIEQLTKKTADDDMTAMIVAQKDAELGELRDRIKELEGKVVELMAQPRSLAQSAMQRTESGSGTGAYTQGYLQIGSASTRLSAGPDDGGATELSLQEVVRQLTTMNNSKDVIISELRSELGALRGGRQGSQMQGSQRSGLESSRSKLDDQTAYDLRLALVDLQARHDALSEDNIKTIEKLRVRTRELQGLMEEIETEIPADNIGTQIDLTRIKALLKVKNHDIAELKESALSTASRHAATCKAMNAENERLSAALKRKESELGRLRSELGMAHEFQERMDGVRHENIQLTKDLKRMRVELDKHEQIHPELSKYGDLVKILGAENDSMKRLLKKRKEQIEYLKNGGDPSLLNTLGGTLPGGTQELKSPEATHSDIINRDEKGNDPSLVQKLTEEVREYDTKVVELSRLIALKDAEITTLRKQTTDGATYKDLLCLLNEKMKRVDELNADVEQRDRELSKLVSVNCVGSAKPRGLTESLYKNSALTRFYSHNEVKDLLKKISDYEAEIAVLKEESKNSSYERLHNLEERFNIVKVEQLEDKVAILNACLADRDGTIERLHAQLQDTELALQSHRANLGLIGAGGVMGSDLYGSQRSTGPTSPGTIISSEVAYNKSLEASNAILQQKLAMSKIKVSDAQQELDWAQSRMNSMHNDLQKYKSMVNSMNNTPTSVHDTVRTPLSGTSRTPLVQKGATPTYLRNV